MYRSCATLTCSGWPGALAVARKAPITGAARAVITTRRVRALYAWRPACTWAACCTAATTFWGPSPRPSNAAMWSSSAAPSLSTATSYSCCRPPPKTQSATANLSGLRLSKINKRFRVLSCKKLAVSFSWICSENFSVHWKQRRVRVCRVWLIETGSRLIWLVIGRFVKCVIVFVAIFKNVYVLYFYWYCPTFFEI